MTDRDVWVPLSDAYPALEAKYAEQIRDPAEAAQAASDAMLRRFADGGLRARPIGFSYVHKHHGKSFSDEDTTVPIAGLESDGCVPVAFWHDYIAAHVKDRDILAGDFSFSDGWPDWTGSTEGRASGVRVNWAGLPIIGSGPAPGSQPTIVEPVVSEQPGRAIGGAERTYDREGMLVYLAAYAHVAPDALLNENGKVTVAHLAKLLAGFWNDPSEEPSESWRSDFARRVRDEIKRQESLGVSNLRGS
jgi:hypothetical protein